MRGLGAGCAVGTGRAGADRTGRSAFACWTPSTQSTSPRTPASPMKQAAPTRAARGSRTPRRTPRHPTGALAPATGSEEPAAPPPSLPAGAAAASVGAGVSGGASPSGRAASRALAGLARRARSARSARGGRSARVRHSVARMRAVRRLRGARDLRTRMGPLSAGKASPAMCAVPPGGTILLVRDVFPGGGDGGGTRTRTTDHRDRPARTKGSERKAALWTCSTSC